MPLYRYDRPNNSWPLLHKRSVQQGSSRRMANWSVWPLCCASLPTWSWGKILIFGLFSFYTVILIEDWLVLICHYLQLGFESLHFARIDFQDRAQRKGDKSREVIWRGSKTFGSSSQVWKWNYWDFSFSFIVVCCSHHYRACVLLQIFTNAFPVHYSPPTGFHFEVDDDFVPVQVLYSREITFFAQEISCSYWVCHLIS